jgi:rare lipoprotein A
VASWYGPGFHGAATASGVIYNQNELTAAHQTLPLGSRVLVTNLDNGRTVEVLINDRGPFAKGRIIDLSYAAARSIDMIGPGTAPVRLEVLQAPYPLRAIPPSLAYTVQLGSFSQLENAQQFRRRLERSHREVDVVSVPNAGGVYHRVQVGTFDSRAAAEEQARQLKLNGYNAMVMEKP